MRLIFPRTASHACSICGAPNGACQTWLINAVPVTRPVDAADDTRTPNRTPPDRVTRTPKEDAR